LIETQNERHNWFFFKKWHEFLGQWKEKKEKKKINQMSTRPPMLTHAPPPWKKQLQLVASNAGDGGI
jgi:hypothetical protein